MQDLKVGNPFKKIEGKIKGNLNKISDENYDIIRAEILKYLVDDWVIKEIIKKEHPELSPEAIDDQCKGLKEPVMNSAIN